MTLKLNGRAVEVTAIEYAGECTRFEEAFWLDVDEPEKAKLTDEELDALGEAYPERLDEARFERQVAEADAAYDRWKDDQMEGGE